MNGPYVPTLVQINSSLGWKPLWPKIIRTFTPRVTVALHFLAEMKHVIPRGKKAWIWEEEKIILPSAISE
jgi:hypothetical protein